MDTHVYKYRGECYASNCMQQVDYFGGDSVMVWMGIHHGGSCACCRYNARHQMSRRDPAALRHSTHDRTETALLNNPHMAVNAESFSAS